jgi:hypothetical protein
MVLKSLYTRYKLVKAKANVQPHANRTLTQQQPHPRIHAYADTSATMKMGPSQNQTHPSLKLAPQIVLNADADDISQKFAAKTKDTHTTTLLAPLAQTLPGNENQAQTELLELKREKRLLQKQLHQFEAQFKLVHGKTLNSSSIRVCHVC